MKARVITGFSNKGGVGKTFTCVNAATALAMAGHKVLLVDFDFQSGQDMARMLNLVPHNSIVNYLPESERLQDPSIIKNFVTTHPSKVDFISAVNTVRQTGQITSDNARLFFKKIIPQYDYVIVDVGKTFTDVLLSVLDMSNLILLITTPDILAVYQIKWGIEVLQSQHFPLRMVKLILNRSESHGGVPWQEVKTALNLDILSRIPSDGKTVGVALNRGVPCVMDSPRSKVSAVFMEMATLLANQDLYVQTTEVLRLRSSTDEKKGINFWETFGIIQDGTLTEIKAGSKKEEDQISQLKKRVHEKLIDRMNIKASPEQLADTEQAAIIKKEAKKIITDIVADESGAFLSSHEERAHFVQEIVNEALGLGPLEEFLADPNVTDIMVNNKDDIFIEKAGKISQTNKKFMSDQQVRMIIDRIIAPLGRRIDESVPMVDARLPDGSRINAIIPPLSLGGPMITIRKFSQERYSADDLIHRFKSISQSMADFIQAAVISRKNILVSGGTGAGKTTLLNIISEYIPDNERIITIEDAAELKLSKSHWARLESRASNVEGRGAISIRDLFVNTLRMRPDRIIIGECRGAEVIDMLQAMNTGHDGSMTTIHANSTRDAITRLNSLFLMSGIELPLRAIYEMVASAIDIIVQVSRFSDGTRKIIGITELTGSLTNGIPELKDVFIFNHRGIDDNGRILGEYVPTGYVPVCFEDFAKRGLTISSEIFNSNRVYPEP